ncbi:biliverdin-producing heme oxygenase [Thermobifida cellulosilytica]|jgi:Heme oxygenase|uniref:Heme oxygenase n=1 Tax=Thermobifida cellulosilytica TB100 TaxID=665004 RepID=A0A147KM86_THECS|nr:biliverdin-producing heme oxygenase [Thermobifida cellulosilytica]KUP98422.1 heme oxygenase [Thermobifida cellulosilytica TB100]
MSTAQATQQRPDSSLSLSERLRTDTRQDHDSAESNSFAKALLAGTLPREGYTALAVQHYFIYTALEEVAQSLATHPVGGAVYFPELHRVPALERDLAFLCGPDWRDTITPLPSTRAYAERIRWTADWPGGFIAHHYTRYLGDLSGGQFIKRVVQQTYGFDDGAGIEFYVFDQLGSLPRFKKSYRAAVDALNLDEAEQQRIIEEAHVAYRFNTEMMNELSGFVPAS